MLAVVGSSVGPSGILQVATPDFSRNRMTDSVSERYRERLGEAQVGMC